MAINSISSSSSFNLFSIEQNQGMSKTNLKTHAFVILSYLLFGIGLALACSVPYFAVIANPVFALMAPILPIALGVLGLRYTSKPDQIFIPLSVQSYVQGQPLGLVNGEANCWMNSAFQMLSHTPSYQKLITRLSSEMDCPSLTFYPLVSAFNRYTQEMKSRVGRAVSSVDTQMLRLMLSRLHPEISNDVAVQVDPMTLIEELHCRAKAFLPLQQQRITEVNGRVKKGPLDNVSSEIGIYLPMDRDHHKSFETMFNDYFHTILNENQKDVVKKSFSQAPEGFLVKAGRFGYVLGNYANHDEGQRKISRAIDFPLNLQLTKDQCPIEQASYEPDAFIFHEGRRTLSGHYIAYVKTDGKWWELNDQKVTSIGDKAIRQKLSNAYIVHYAKKTS